MNFNSIEYAVFFVIVFALYWSIKPRYRWILLLVSSYYFYMSWKPAYVVLILATTIVSYSCALLLERTEGSQSSRKILIKKLILTGALLVCLGILFFFKYFNFFMESVTGILSLFTLHIHPSTLSIVLPVGISFYTFQTLSYVIDVYRGDVPAEHHFGYYATFISFFPQLVAGPIERPSNLLPQIKSEISFDYDRAVYGARQVLWGLFKKIAVADVLAVYVDMVYENIGGCTGFDYVVAILFFTIQIYCDFSGYSDIAIGSAGLLGINLMQNFRSPYFSTSIREFWSRWHISLSTWFRDYLYIPLGGNRCSKARNSFNLLVTFLVSGLWHGASVTYVIWGGIHGVAQVIEKLLGLDRKRKSRAGRVLSGLAVFVFCNIAWVFFRAPSFSDAIQVISHAIPGISPISSFTHTTLGIKKAELIFISVNIFIVALFDRLSLDEDVFRLAREKKHIYSLLVEYTLVILIGIALFNSSGSNQFVYFQF